MPTKELANFYSLKVSQFVTFHMLIVRVNIKVSVELRYLLFARKRRKQLDKIQVIGGNPVCGNIPIYGAKNAALPLMACSLLSAEPLELTNIPHLADDEYVRQLASAVREKLPEEFRVWVEYSNEVWNGQFKQYEEVGRCASATGKKEFGAAMICYSERADQVFRTWRAAFGESASRVVRVVGSQAVNPWVSKNILKHAKLYERADALAIAPYFGFIARRKNEAERARLSVDELLSRTEREILPKAIEHIKAQAEVAERYGLDLVAYEGGQHYSAAGGVENNEKITALFDAINRHPRMKDLYLRYLEAWSQSGGRLFMHYNDVGPYTKWGRWGLKEYPDQPRADAPKFDAVMEFIEQTPRWW